MQSLIKQLFITILKEETKIEQQRQVLAELEQFDPCLAFHNFANSQTNQISPVDMHKYLRNYGVDEVTEVDCDMIVNYFSCNQNGCMSIQDFIQMVLSCDNSKLRRRIEKKPTYFAAKHELIDRQVEAEIVKLVTLEILFNRKQEDLKQKIHSCKDFTEEKAFLSVDDWNYGYIDKTNLKGFLRKHGQNISTKDILKIIRRMDLDGDARLSKQEFLDAIKPFEPFSKMMVRQKAESEYAKKALSSHKRNKTPVFNCCDNDASGNHKHDDLMRLSRRQIDSIRTQAQDRVASKMRQSMSPLKYRPNINQSILVTEPNKNNKSFQNGSMNSSFYAISSAKKSSLNKSAQLSKRKQKKINKKLGNQTSFQSPNNIDQGLDSEVPLSAHNQPLNIIVQSSSNKKSRDVPFEADQQKPKPIQIYNQNKSDLLQELEAKFLDYKNASQIKYSPQRVKQVSFSQQPLLNAIQDDLQSSKMNSSGNNHERSLKDPFTQSFNRNDSTMHSSPLRMKALNYTGSSIAKDLSSHFDLSESPKRDYSSDYHSLRGRQNITSQNNIHYQQNNSPLRLSARSKQNQNSLLELSQIHDSFYSRRLMMKFFQEFIFMEQEVEDYKIKLALKQDFNLADAFGLIDKLGKGYVDMHEFLNVMNHLSYQSLRSPSRFSFEDIDIMFKRYQRDLRTQSLRYTDFAKMLLPLDQYYAKMQTVKRVNYPSRVDIDGQSQNVYLLTLLLSKVIENERRAEHIRREIYQRYRLNMRGLFQSLDIERDGALSFYEISELFKQNQRHFSAGDFEFLKLRFDKDNDGRISFQEFEQEIMPQSSSF